MEIFLIALLFVMTALTLINWSIHRSMVKNSTNKYGVANYKKFLEEFNKVEWTLSEWFNGSLFSESNDKYHAQIIAFNGKGMIISNPISYLLVILYVKIYIKKNFEDNRKINEWR